MQWSQSGYSSNEMMQMQQDALRRVREMQRRANDNLRSTQQYFNGEPIRDGPYPASESDNHLPEPVETFEPKTNKRNHSDASTVSQRGLSLPFLGMKPLSGLLDSFGLDQERLLILILIILLINEDADKTLILALCYLML